MLSAPYILLFLWCAVLCDVSMCLFLFCLTDHLPENLETLQAIYDGVLLFPCKLGCLLFGEKEKMYPMPIGLSGGGEEKSLAATVFEDTLIQMIAFNPNNVYQISSGLWRMLKSVSLFFPVNILQVLQIGTLI